ncbi:malonyl-[acyl-carrier protein] O-methyltransferase-like isoform X2 [Dermacentor silvarum]|nr:malonyl-[acyl-carrier protein] O-methyltransferase-like isoform X2 [Dermacentor silvarum]
MASTKVSEKLLQGGPFKSQLAPEMYAELSANPGEHLKGIFQVFKTVFTTLSDESQQFLDLGCGAGDFTREWILPSCQPCKRILAVDASTSMLEYAREKYPHEKVVYEHLDIDDDVSAFLKNHGTFQRVYSFNMLHWSRDLRRALAHITQLLAPGGECLLFFVARGFVFESFKELSRLEPWSKYANVLLQAVPKSHDIVNQKDQHAYLTEAIASAGLVPYTAEVLVRNVLPRRRIGAYQGMAEIANPLLSILRDDEKPALLDALSTHLPKWRESYSRGGGPVLSSRFLVHAVKP